MAIGLQSLALQVAPQHHRAAADLEVARSAIASTEVAEQLYAAALALEPDLANHHRSFGSLIPFVGMERAEGLVRAALDVDPSLARAHAALGNILTRRGQGPAATGAYGIATMLDPNYADAHMAMAELCEAAVDEAAAAAHRRAALSSKVLYEVHAPHAARRVLALKSPGRALSNVSLDFCIDHNRTDLNVYYITTAEALAGALLENDVIFNAIAESEESEATIDLCREALANVERPIVNHPKHLGKVRRSRLFETLRDVAGCVTPPTLRLSREVVAQAKIELDFPILIRPVDTHRGDGLERVTSPGEVEDYLGRHPAAHFNATPFVDYRSADGYFRKYRISVVAGKPYPYHLAISEDWLVHYWRVSDLMREHEWMRAEEERFLRDPSSVFATWDVAFSGIAEALGLDLFGVDCAVAADGRVLVFECDPAAFLHCREPVDGVFAYKYDYVPKIFCAIEELLDSMAWRPAMALP